MRRGLVSSFVLATAAVPLFAALTFGLSWFSHNSSVKSTSVDNIYNAKLANGKTLPEGNYRLEFPLNTKTPQLKFFQNGKLVATANARVKSKMYKNSDTEVQYNHKGSAQYITEVQPEGMKESLILTKSNKMKSGS